jgi:uncharacterized membrane protein required for colicin V production
MCPFIVEQTLNPPSSKQNSAMRSFLNLAVLFLFSHGIATQDYTFEWKYSLYAPYVNSEGHSNNWNIDALINNHHHIQLTPDLPGRSGNLFTKQVSPYNCAHYLYLIETDQP